MGKFMELAITEEQASLLYQFIGRRDQKYIDTVMDQEQYYNTIVKHNLNPFYLFEDGYKITGAFDVNDGYAIIDRMVFESLGHGFINQYRVLIFDSSDKLAYMLTLEAVIEAMTCKVVSAPIGLFVSRYGDKDASDRLLADLVEIARDENERCISVKHSQSVVMCKLFNRLQNVADERSETVQRWRAVGSGKSILS